MTGGLMQLVAYGAQDTYLTGNPQITFFKIVYRRHTNFSMETISQTINGDTKTDTSRQNRGTVTIARHGDLLGKIYVGSKTNGITDGSEIIKEVSIQIGGQEIDKQTKEWFEIWSELTIPEDKKLGFKNMIGCLNNNLNSTGTMGVNYVQIPLHFWFCRNSGLSLPLIALQYHEVDIEFVFGTGVGVNADLTIFCDYFYLDTDERKRFAQVSHEYLIEQLQIQNLNGTKDHKLSLNHPIKELIWTSSTDYGTALLSLNGHERFEKQNKEYFQLRQPFDYHTAIPGYNIPISEKTELLTTPVDVGVRKHNVETTVTETDPSYITLSSNNFVFGNVTDFASTNNIATETNDTTTPFKRFKLGDMITIVISSYPDGTRNVEGDGLHPGDTQIDAEERGTAGDTETDITSSKTSFHRITGINTTTNTITFEPEITSKNGNNNLINNTAADTDLGDHVYIYILGRVQLPESRCSKLKKNINVYSFSLRPEDHQPSGTCNFSRIDTARLITQNPLATGDKLYAINYNILRVMSGMGGLAYSN
jgi:hypothetical protein